MTDLTDRIGELTAVMDQVAYDLSIVTGEESGDPDATAVDNARELQATLRSLVGAADRLAAELHTAIIEPV